MAEAKFAAQLRNYHWQSSRTGRGGNAGITLATHRTPYPAQKTDQSSDRADGDGGGNFGRVARYGLLDTFVDATHKQLAAGIPIKAWLKFFKVFSDSARDIEAVLTELDRLFRMELLESAEQKDLLVQCIELLLAKIREGSIGSSPTTL